MPHGRKRADYISAVLTEGDDSGAGEPHTLRQGRGRDAPLTWGAATSIAPVQAPPSGIVRPASDTTAPDSITVAPGAVTEIAGPVADTQTIRFLPGYGTLALDDPGSMAGSIVGFTGTAAASGQSDVIDLVGIGSLDNSNLSYSPISGVLTVTAADGSTVAELHLVGEYSDASFAVAADGNGGTDIFDPTTYNAIVLENQKAGTPMSVWAINGDLDAQGDDSAIEGFATSISISPGQVENFKIRTGSTNYRIDIYRLGYYGGDGARLISSQTINRASPQVQPTPLFDSTLREVDCGNWAVSASWTVPADAVSGMYIAKLTTLNGTIGQNMIPFVVNNGGAASDIKFQTNDTTWQAYNPWGGYNVYTGPSQSRADRGYAVSYNRPIDINSTLNQAGSQDFPFSCEFPAIYFLEENGYDVSYLTGWDAANNPALMANANVYLVSGHDEYWSTSQYQNVMALADAGTNMVFMTGNQCYWNVAWAGGPSGQSNSTMIEYKDLWSGGQLDPAGTAGGGTSTYRDPIYGPGLPENSLKGNLFEVDSDGTMGNISIPYDLSQFRIWTNTAAANLQPGQSLTLSNVLGYEWDADYNNGFRPAGVIDLSSTTTPVNTLMRDYGVSTQAGVATHNLTLYRDQTSGALIFSTGTVMWSWGLSDQHAIYNGYLTAPESPVIQQSLVNMLADMGVQPETLMQSLVYAAGDTDRTPPASRITSIGKGGTISADQVVTISGTAADAGGGKVAMVEISTDSGTTWNRATGFNTWTYSWVPKSAGSYTIETRATDDIANVESPSDATTVAVVGSSNYSLFNASPGDLIYNSLSSSNADSGDKNAIELGMQFKAAVAGTLTGIRFYKGVNDTGTHVGSLWSSTGTLLARGTFVNETAGGWQTLIFDTPVTITAGTTYVAGYQSSGHYPVDSNYFSSTYSNGPLAAVATGNGPGVYTYGSNSPFPTSGGTRSNYWVDVVFTPASQILPPIAKNDGGFLDYGNTPLYLPGSALLANDTDPNGLPITVSAVGSATHGTVALNATTQTITFTPDNGYTGPAGFSYTVVDQAGASGTANVSLSVTAPALSLWSISTTPAEMKSYDPNPVELGVKFRAAAAGSILGLRYYKGASDTGTHVGSLWTATGSLLASATFTNETFSGWQTVTFATPVSIAAGTTYVAAYHSNGYYADTTNYFAGAYSNGPLTALASGTSGNGVYAYSSNSVFPTSTYEATNYWVDVLYSPNALSPPVANADSFTAYYNAPLAITGASLLANDADPNGLALSVTGVANPSHGTVIFSASTNTVTFTPASGYTGPASFTYTIADTGGATASGTVNVTVNAPLPPVANPDSGIVGIENIPLTIGSSTLLANDIDPNGLALSVTGVGNASHGTVAYDSGTKTISFTPTAGYTGPAGFTYTIADTAGGTAAAAVSLAINPPLPPVANDDSGYTGSANTPFAIPAPSLLANDTDPQGLALSITGVSNPSHGTVAYNSTTATITFTPDSGYTGPASFIYTVADAAGATASASVSVNFTGTTYSLWSSSAVPAETSDADANAVELGVKFTASSAGHIIGLSYYKGPNDAGTHVGSLWTSSGTLLASAAFVNETASGWQEVNFATPVSITAGTTYVAAYHSNGHYAASGSYFTNAYSNGPLTALASGSSGGNGVYSYGVSSVFPSKTYSATNYWVDVIYQPGALAPPVATSDSVVAIINVPLTISAATLLANDTDPNGLTLSISGVSNPSNGTVTFDAVANTVTFTPKAGYSGAASFVYAIVDTAGGTASASVAVSVQAAQPPTANADSGFVDPANAPLAIAAWALLANDTDPNGLALSVTGVSNPTHGSVAFDAGTNTITFTPTAGYVGPAGFTYSVADAAGATASGSVSLNVSAAIASLWSDSAVPTVTSDSDASAVELGVKFTASSDGNVIGVRYYKGTGDIGTHMGSLWSSTGALLASASFTNETASGWQTVAFASPVAITAGTTYVAAYHSNGHYADTPNYFTSAYTNGPLTAPADGSSGGNGVYAYGSSSVFPTSSFGAANYWVDVLYTPATVTPPVPTNDSLVAIAGAPVTIAASSLLANDTDPNGLALSVTGVGNASHGTVSYDATTRAITFTPTAGYTGAAGFSYTVTDSGGGSATANVSLSVGSGSTMTASTLFTPSSVPASIDTKDPKGVELGVKVTAAKAGVITGMQFYKGPQDSGPHTAELWSSDGTLLASASFANETASGWQSVNFATPVAIAAGETDIASYHTSVGYYSADVGYFATAHTSGPLTAPASAAIGGNGVYAYGASSVFPTSSFDSTNYWVDVTFKA